MLRMVGEVGPGSVSLRSGEILKEIRKKKK
jgi:hypothetical protein